MGYTREEITRTRLDFLNLVKTMTAGSVDLKTALQESLPVIATLRTEIDENNIELDAVMSYTPTILVYLAVPEHTTWALLMLHMSHTAIITLLEKQQALIDRQDAIVTKLEAKQHQLATLKEELAVCEAQLRRMLGPLNL